MGAPAPRDVGADRRRLHGRRLEVVLVRDVALPEVDQVDNLIVWYSISIV